MRPCLTIRIYNEDNIKFSLSKQQKYPVSTGYFIINALKTSLKRVPDGKSAPVSTKAVAIIIAKFE